MAVGKELRRWHKKHHKGGISRQGLFSYSATGSKAKYLGLKIPTIKICAILFIEILKVQFGLFAFQDSLSVYQIFFMIKVKLFYKTPKCINMFL